MFLKNKNINFNQVYTIAITAIITFSLTTFVYFGWSYFRPGIITFSTNNVSADTVRKFASARSILKSDFYEPVNEDKLLEGAIAGMAESLGDRYTSYYTKEQWSELENYIEGSFEGIGVTLQVDEKDGLITVIDIMEGSPAQKAGIKVGDRLFEVDGKDVRNTKLETIISMIKGSKKKSVKLKINRPNQNKTLDIEVPIEKIKTQNIISKMLDNKIGYIRIVRFDAEAASYFDNSLKGLLKDGAKGLIIDVRDDPGGYYDQVVKISDSLLPKCTIVYTEDRNKKRETEYSDDKHLEIPMVVLVNGNSASASEILAGAIKDNKKGILIGTKTYGKGLVQETVPFKDGSALKITIKRYFTPSGVCIQGKGIEPDIQVALDKKYEKTPAAEVPQEDDLQLKRGIEELMKVM